MITTDINKAKAVLIKNDLVAIPTETVYGLAGNAFSEEAVKKIYRLKRRPFYNPLIVHVKSTEYLDEVATDIPDVARELAGIMWPGPLTLVLNKQKYVPDLVTSGMNTVAVRVPNHKVSLVLLNELPFPLAAPSANPFGSISPTSAQHVFNYFGSEIDIILDGGDCERGLESTIIGFENNQAVLYRYGSITAEEIEKVAGGLIVHAKHDNKPIAPGMLAKHYSPKTITVVSDNVKKLVHSYKDKKAGFLLFNSKINNEDNIVQEVLSPNGDLNEAAKNLYAALHRLDSCNLDVIVVEYFPDEGIGKTINDRLQRASS